MAFSSIGNIWHQWNVRGFIILSLFLQIFLTLFATLRKKTANRHILFFLWLAYLMADWVAAFAIGLISQNHGNSSAHVAEIDGALQAFWASFLLLHLGGPDTITAFSLEDSSLWQRHLLSLIFQIGAAIYVFVQIFPTDNWLVIPTMLVFLAGVTKNAERILALYLSSLPRLREWALPQITSSQDAYNNLFEELKVQPGGNSNEEAKLAESIVVKHADYFLQIFKGFLVDLIFTRQQREMSCEYFHNVSAVDALRLISVELNFIYDVLHTKALAIHSKWSCIFRVIAFANVVIAFFLFNCLKKHRLKELDVEITHSLLFGGIALDVIALFMLAFSDWTVARIKRYNTRSYILDSLLHKMVFATDYLSKPNVTYKVFNTSLVFRRWSESISACNLFSETVKESPRKMYKRDRCWGIITFSKICTFPFSMAEKIISCFHQAGDTIARGYFSRNTTNNPYIEVAKPANVKYVSKNPLMKELWIFIFTEIRRKSENANTLAEVREIFEARGNLFLENRPGRDCENLLQLVRGSDYDTNIIRWHVATEILYIRESSTATHDKMDFSKILSDYMLYLLFNQPNVMSAVAGIARITSNHVLTRLHSFSSEHDRIQDVKRLCDKCFEMNPSHGSMSELDEGVHLAREIQRLGDRKWDVMSGVWVEMLSYAASHIKIEAHVEVLNKGGELLAFVWLLMAHFGCFYKSEWGICYEPWDENGFTSLCLDARRCRRLMYSQEHNVEDIPSSDSDPFESDFIGL